MAWFSRTRSNGSRNGASTLGNRPTGGLPLDADSRLKEMLLRQDLEIRDLEAVQNELVSTLLSLMNAIGQITGAGFHVTPLAGEARAIRTPEEAVALRESLRNLLFESCVAPIHGDERESLYTMVKLLIAQTIATVGDWGGLGPELTELSEDLGRDENRGQLDAAVTKLKDLLFRVSVLTGGLAEERDGLRELVTVSLAKLHGIAESIGGAVPEQPAFGPAVDDALAAGDLSKARLLLEHEGLRLAGEVRRLGAARAALSELLSHADERVRSLANALDRTEVPVDVDAETGLGNRRALEAMLRDPSNRARWVLAARIHNAPSITDRYGVAALGRVLKAVAERMVPMVPDALGHFRVGPAALVTVFAGEDPAAIRAKAVGITAAVEQTKFLFRTDVVSVRFVTELLPVSSSHGPLALLDEP